MKKRVIALSLAVLASVAGVAAAEEPKRPVWDKEAVELFASLPVQDHGRVKPMDTYAGFVLLILNGKRTCYPEGEEATFPPSLKPVPWLMDVLFRPELAKTYPVLLVDNGEVLDAIGMPHEKRRGRYSFNDFEPFMPKLREIVGGYHQRSEKRKNQGLEDELTPIENQIASAYHNVTLLEAHLHFLDFARQEYPLRATPALQAVFGPEDTGLAAVLGKMTAWHDLIEHADAPTKEAIRVSLDDAGMVQTAIAIALLPDPDPQESRWLTPQSLVSGNDQDDPRGILKGHDFAPKIAKYQRQIALLGQFERLAREVDQPVKFDATLGQFHDGLVALTKERGEYSKVPIEMAFYKGDFFYRALAFYIFGFVLVSVSWLWPSKLVKKGNYALLAIATALLIAGIVIRCVIASRPPVKTLYETIPFITAMAILASCVIEWINRQGIAISLAPLMGALGMFITNKYEFKEAVAAGDTVSNPVAVLDTNFWLSTHVTSVTTGYSAGLLATALGHVWLIGKMTGYRSGDDKFYKSVARMTYGVICFGLLFSVVGTILGGIWANYSWGRFWGWDPKENGALLICIWELMILHARMGGYIRDFGLSVMAVLGGVVVAFSWWGVNLLNTGLHSYGFTSGVRELLIGYCVFEAVLAVVGLGWRLGQGSGKSPIPEPDAKATA